MDKIGVCEMCDRYKVRLYHHKQFGFSLEFDNEKSRMLFLLDFSEYL